MSLMLAALVHTTLATEAADLKWWAGCPEGTKVRIYKTRFGSGYKTLPKDTPTNTGIVSGMSKSESGKFEFVRVNVNGITKEFSPDQLSLKEGTYFRLTGLQKHNMKVGRIGTWFAQGNFGTCETCHGKPGAREKCTTCIYKGKSTALIYRSNKIPKSLRLLCNACQKITTK